MLPKILSLLTTAFRRHYSGWNFALALNSCASLLSISCVSPRKPPWLRWPWLGEPWFSSTGYNHKIKLPSLEPCVDFKLPGALLLLLSLTGWHWCINSWDRLLASTASSSISSIGIDKDFWINYRNLHVGSTPGSSTGIETWPRLAAIKNENRRWVEMIDRLSDFPSVCLWLAMWGALCAVAQ